MPSAKKPEITAGQSLDVQPGVSNIGENQATLEALRNANIDGQDVYPQSVSTKRFNSQDGNFSGLLRTGQMLIGGGGFTVSTAADGGEPTATGFHIGPRSSDNALVVQLIKAGVAQMTLNADTGNASFTGTVTATSGTFTGTVNANAGYFVGSITIGTDTAVGVAATGTWLTNTQLLMKKSGVTKVNIDTSTDTYYVAGELYASKFTVIANAANSVNFGTSITVGGDITVGGNLILNTTNSTSYIHWDGVSGTRWLKYDATSQVLTLNIASQIVIQANTGIGKACTLSMLDSGPAYLTAYTNLTLSCGSLVGDVFALKRGGFSGTTVLSFVGNSNMITCPGNIIVGAGADYVVTGPDATTPMRLGYQALGVSVTGTGAFATNAWTHGWNTGTATVYFSATMQDINTAASTGISNVRVERTSTTTCKVEFLVATYASTQIIYFDVIAMGPA